MAIAAGCGGGDGARLTDAQYTTRLRGICAVYNSLRETIPTPRTVREVGRWAEDVLPLFRNAISRAEKLRPPADKQKLVDEFLSVAALEMEVLEELEAAAENGDRIEVQTLSRRGQVLDGKSDELAEQLGVPECVTS